MKKSIKTIVLALATIGMLTGCFGEASTSNKTSNNSQSNVSSDNSSSNISTDTSITSSSTSTSTTSSAISSTTSSAPTSSSSSSSTSSIVIKTQITLSAADNKTTLEINETVQIVSNVEGVTYSTTEGATIANNGLFQATKEGTYVVTAHKDGNYIDGEITITVLPAKEDIVLTAVKTTLYLNETVTINSNIEGGALTTTEGATIVNNVFSAYKEGTYVVTGTKEGRYNAGTLTISVAFARTEAKVKAALKDLRDGENYTLTGVNDLGVFSMYRTKDYFFDSQLNEGKALFTNIDSKIEGERVAHYIKMADNKLVIGNDIVYSVDNKPVPATDLYKVDAFKYVDIDALTFEEHDGHFVSRDDYLIFGIANVLGSTMAYYGCVAVQYSFNEKYELVANLLFTEDGETISYDSAAMFGNLTYTKVGQTAAPVLDEQYKAVTVANEGMSEEVASSFMLKQGHIKSTIKILTGESEELLGTSEYNFDENYLIDDKYITRSNQTIHNFYTNDNGYAKYIGIGPNNEVVTSYANEWESFTFPFATLDTTQFRQTGEHTYSYLGQESNAVAGDLAWASFGDYKVAYITAHEENGKIVSFTCETANELVDISDASADKAEYVIRKLVIEIQVLPYETIVAPAPFEADADTVRINAYLDELMGADANYSIYIGDQGNYSNWKNIKVTSDTILINEWKNSTDNGYTGYHKLSDGSVIKFSAKKNGNAVENAKYEGDVELEEGQPLVSLLGLNLAAEAMMFDEDNNIVFKDGVLYAGYGLYNQFEYNKYAIDGTIVFNVGYNDHITGINYKYGAGDTAKEFCYTNTYGTTALSSAFETELLEVLPTLKEAPHPTTWKEESEAIYNDLYGLLGEYVSLIPYVYDPTYSGIMTSSVNDTNTMVSIAIPSNMSYSTEFNTKLIDACVANGFTKESAKKATLIVGSKKITVQILGFKFGVLYKDI